MAFLLTMMTDTRSSGISGDGAPVVRRTVLASMIFLLMIALVNSVKLAGLFLIVAGRSSEYTTSSAVTRLPSLNLAPLRILNSQVSPLTSDQDSASPGASLPSALRITSGSNMCSITLALVVMFWKCGSIDVGGLLMATLKSCAMAGTDQHASSATAAPARRSIFVANIRFSFDYKADRPHSASTSIAWDW